MSKQGTYIRIQEVEENENGRIVSADARSVPKVVQLRNVAYTKSASAPSTRAQVLDALMPLSRVPWGTTPTLIRDQNDKKSKKTNAINMATAAIGYGKGSTDVKSLKILKRHHPQYLRIASTRRYSNPVKCTVIRSIPNIQVSKNSTID
ncbi:MAG: hypothetical protein J3Q66DRAFT_397468 [Benniella sp.]|nr:MAG: hypothetical protein J3Q66DRAFT_397468 [Benniella sp.]